jgi:transketolase
MPSMNQFLALPLSEQKTILPNPDKTITLEALSTFGWHRIGHFNLGIDTYGQSAPGPVVMAYYGFTAELLSKKIASIILGKN